MADNIDKQVMYIMSRSGKTCNSQILPSKIGTKIQLEAKIDFSTIYINFKMKFLLQNSNQKILIRNNSHGNWNNGFYLASGINLLCQFSVMQTEHILKDLVSTRSFSRTFTLQLHVFSRQHCFHIPKLLRANPFPFRPFLPSVTQQTRQ